jgi:hydrogenase nickel incorporation protein HypB
MCTICGCGAHGQAGASDGHALHDHPHDHPHDDAHGHAHRHRHAEPALPPGRQPGGGAVAADGSQSARLIRVEQDILRDNDRWAEGTRAIFRQRHVLALNLLSGPGAGKTRLVVRTIEDLQARLPIVVIEGDQETSRDAERIRATGAPAVQINTGKGCHLDARMVRDAVGQLPLAAGSLLFIENVGNLVCPAAFDLGEAHKVVLLSVTEGEDKPLKYASMFQAASVMLLTKIDLLPHLDFDVDRCCAMARRVNPGIVILPVSAVSGAGLAAWYAWIDSLLAPMARPAAVEQAGI